MRMRDNFFEDELAKAAKEIEDSLACDICGLRFFFEENFLGHRLLHSNPEYEWQRKHPEEVRGKELGKSSVSKGGGHGDGLPLRGSDLGAVDPGIAWQVDAATWK